MTCCIAARYDDGLLLATDSRVTAGSTKLTLGEAKSFEWRGLIIAYSGALHYVQELQTKPSAGYKYGVVGSFQQLLWDFPPCKKDIEETEFLVVDEACQMYVVTGYGDSVWQKVDYAVVGSEYGWIAMDLEYPRLRVRNLGNTKRMLAKVLRVVAARDNTVDEPLFYEEIPELQ